MLTIVFDSVIVSENPNARRTNEPIHASIQSGQICAIYGDSQSGKTSLLLAAGGFLPIRSGSIQYKDSRHEDRPVSLHRRDIGIGIIQRVAPLFETLTVREHLRSTARLFRVRKVKERVEQMIETYELSMYQHRRIKDLPYFEQFRVSLACAGIHDPLLVLLDEPERGLTTDEWQLAQRNLRNIADNGAIVLLTTVLDQIADACDQTISLQRKEVASNDDWYDREDRTAANLEK